MEHRLDYEDFKESFGLWAEKFKPFIESEEMFAIYQRIKQDAQTETIVPRSSDTFRSFFTSNPDNLLVIMYLMDPYPRKYKNGELQATGIPMDCSNSPDDRLQPSLEKFYDGIEANLGHKIARPKDLSYLLQQGVLLLNTDLTCKLNKTGSHKGLWKPFQKYFLEEVMWGKPAIYCLFGAESNEMERFISPLGNRIHKIEHPSAAQYRKGDWYHKDIFNTINKELHDDNPMNYIYWDKAEFDDQPPF